jgi:hypothetical protein
LKSKGRPLNLLLVAAIAAIAAIAVIGAFVSPVSPVSVWGSSGYPAAQDVAFSKKHEAQPPWGQFCSDCVL